MHNLFTQLRRVFIYDTLTLTIYEREIFTWLILAQLLRRLLTL